MQQSQGVLIYAFLRKLLSFIINLVPRAVSCLQTYKHVHKYMGQTEIRAKTLEFLREQNASNFEWQNERRRNLNYFQESGY